MIPIGDAAAFVVRRQGRPLHLQSPLANLTDEWGTVCRRADRSIDFDFYRRRATAHRVRVRRDAALTSACAGVLAMTAIYLALFFAAEQTRTTNPSHPAASISAPPIRNAADVRL